MRLISRWFLLTTLALVVQNTYGQTGRSSAVLLKAVEETGHSSWNVSSYYGVLSDFAVNRDPRAYTHSLGMSLSYQFTPALSASSSLGIRAEMVGGQINKEEDRSYGETLSPNVNFGLAFVGKLPWKAHSYVLYGSADPLLDKASRLEGYKAAFGTGAKLTFNFFQKRWAMSHGAGVSSILNTYAYASDQRANPDYYYAYGLTNSLRLWGSLRASYRWGIRYTRYLDDYLAYSYANAYSLSYSWERLSAGLAYENGGHTDNGDVSLWFTDDYRRIVSLSVGYDF